MNFSEKNLDTVFGRLSEAAFVVLGDFCLDAYCFLDPSASEKSVETGLPTEPVRFMKFTPGGAGNVAVNLKALGASRIYALGVVGDDLFGREYLRLLNSSGVDTTYLLTQSENWATCVYTKLYEGDREQPRLDFGCFNRLSSRSVETLIGNLRDLLPGVDLILVNQQLLHGVHTPEFREELKKVIGSNRERIFLLDSRNFNEEYEGTLRKLNDREAARSAGFDPDAFDYRNEERIREAAKILFKRWKTPLFVTRGDRGSLVFDGTDFRGIPGFHIIDKIDTVGAGDSMFAGIASGLAAGLSSQQALYFASLVAGVTVRKLFQTGTATEKEIRALAKSHDFRLNPEKAESELGKNLWKETAIEILRLPPKRPLRFAVFDHDGTVSTLREGWERIMEPVMVRSILGDMGENVDGEVVRKVSAEIREFIDKTTGLQTLVQMMSLVRLVKELGLVPPEKIVSAHEYKKRYLEELNKIVKDRIRQLDRGEMCAADFTIKGVIPFLENLRQREVTLFLASGTDEEDVRREARALGYEELFNGGIFGAREDVTKEPKKIVLDMVLDTIGKENGNGIVTFGDGPVEIRETWKIGGITVGVASDEVRRFGLNREKRKRLVLAGADLIIPDFSQWKSLADLLFEE